MLSLFAWPDFGRGVSYYNYILLRGLRIVPISTSHGAVSSQYLIVHDSS